MDDKKPDDSYSDQETAERLDRALKRSFNMPHKPHKAGKSEAAPKCGPGVSRKADKSRKSPK